MTTITEPGLYDDIAEAAYHGDPYSPSLSSTMAKLILKSPAHLRHHLDEGSERKPAFDFGSAVHTLILGKGWPITILDFPDWRSKEARLQREAAWISESIPMLQKDYEEAAAVEAAVRAHPIAGPLFAGEGKAEVSAFGEHESGVKMRGRFDWATPTGIIVDLKTARSADPNDFASTAANFGYDVQAAHYMAVHELATGESSKAFVHVLVEKEPPYLVSVVQLDDEFIDLGRSKLERAVRRYEHALNTDEWPGYPATLHPITPKPYMVYDEDDQAEKEES